MRRNTAWLRIGLLLFSILLIKVHNDVSDNPMGNLLSFAMLATHDLPTLNAQFSHPYHCSTPWICFNTATVIPVKPCGITNLRIMIYVPHSVQNACIIAQPFYCFLETFLFKSACRLAVFLRQFEHWVYY